MVIIFSHPCNKKIRIKRKVPKIGTTKRITNYYDGGFEWYFTNYEYHFIFKFNNDGNHKLFVCSGQPNNWLDWGEYDSDLIIEK